MFKAFQSNKVKGDEQRILPLVNVVFLLLIFFMLTGRLVADDPFDIAPPRSISDGMPEQRDLLVLVGLDGRLALDGEMIDPAMFKRMVATRLAASTALRVRVKVDNRIDATRLVALLETLRDAGVERLFLLTVPEIG